MEELHASERRRRRDRQRRRRLPAAVGGDVAHRDQRRGTQQRAARQIRAAWQEAVLQACRSGDWWVARHGIEVIGHLLSGATQPMYGDDSAHLERFHHVRDQLAERWREAYGAMLTALAHGDSAKGRAAFARWVDEQLGR